MSVLSYDPKAVSIVYAGQILTGYADGTFVSVDRDEDTWALQVGADGEATRSKSNDKSGTITITLRQGSPSNAILSALAKADELTNGGVSALAVIDNSGQSIHTAETAWIQKPASTEYGQESGELEWTIRTDNLETFPGGNDASGIGPQDLVANFT